MATKEEKLKRKLILDELAKKHEEEFLKSLPMSVSQFKLLFDYLDLKLENCDDSLKLTRNFLLENNIKNTDQIITWLQENGGFCDCEVLANIEEQFESF